METAGIAQRSGTIGPPSPFWCVDAIAAVASARRSSALSIVSGGPSRQRRQWLKKAASTYPSALLDFRHAIWRLDGVPIHGNVLIFFIRALWRLGTFAGPLALQRCHDHLSALFEGAFEVLDVGKHVAHFPFSREALRDGLRSVLFLGNAPVGLGEVEDGARAGPNLQLDSG